MSRDKRTIHVNAKRIVDDTITQVRLAVTQLEILREQIDLIEHELGRDEVCPIKLTPAERIIWSLLMKFETVSASVMSAALWGGLPDADVPRNPDALIKTTLYNIRRKLVRYLIDNKMLAYLKSADGNPISCGGGSRYGLSIYSLDPHIKNMMKVKTTAI